MQCKVGKVIGNLHALKQLMPETMDNVALVQYMPMLLLSNMKKVGVSNLYIHMLASHFQHVHASKNVKSIMYIKE